MAVQDTKIHKDAKVAHEFLVVPITTAVSQADVIALAVLIGFAFEIISAQCYCRTEAGVVSADVKIGTVSALNAVMAFVTATRVDAVLAAPLASRRGSATDVLNIHFTTDGTGVLTNGFVVVKVRPVPLNSEIATE